MPIKYFSYYSPVSVVSTKNQVRPALEKLKNGVEPGAIYGFDMEWKPMFDNSSYNKTALIQLYVKRRDGIKVAVLFRINKLIEESHYEEESGFPEELKTFLEDKNILKSGINITNDALKLKRDFDVDLRGFLEILDIDTVKEFKNPSMKKLAKQFLNIDISKKLSTSNWENHRLSRKQIGYAATDAFISRELYIVLKSF